MKLFPEFDPHIGAWCLEVEGKNLQAPSLRELSGLLPPGSKIGDYYPEGYTAVRDNTGESGPRFVITKRGFTINHRKATALLLPGQPGKSRPQKYFTADELKLIKDKFHSGVKCRVIAQELNRSYDSIQEAIRRYNLHRTKRETMPGVSGWAYTPELVERVKELFYSGDSYRTIAKKVNRTIGSISGIAKRHGIVRARAPHDAAIAAPCDANVDGANT